MNSLHGSTKEWQPGEPTDASLQYAPIHHHGYPLSGPVHPSIHHQHQRYVPCQGNSTAEMSVTTQPSPMKAKARPPRTVHLLPAALPSPALNGSAPYRKRNRSDSLFSTETGPLFSSTKPFDNLYAIDRTSLLTARIYSKMDRGFFLADNDWTCYRRNYFQVSGAFSIHGLSHYYPEQEPPCLVRTQDGMFHPVRSFFLGISARVSSSEKQIELVQHTPKRDKGPQMTPKPKPIVPGGNLNMSTVGTNRNIVTFERIQFKTATANNGKRRAAQQYYVCIVELFAEIDGGEQIKVGSCQSASLVVRGRSPGHYTDSQQDRASASTATPAPIPSPYHDRFYPSRPSYTQHIMGEYSPYSPYYPPPDHHHTHPYMSSMGMAPASAEQAPPPQPNYHGAPYMVADMGVSSPRSPHYPQEFAVTAAAAAASGATAPCPPQNMVPTVVAAGSGGYDQPKHSPNGCFGSPTDWSRSRISSTGSLAQSYFSGQATPTLSSTASQASAFSPTTPTTPYVSGPPRKYSTANNACNRQSA